MIPSAVASTTGQAHDGNQAWATVVLVAFLLVWPALTIWFLWRNDDPGDSGGDGGSGQRPPEPPAPDGPVWWPEFEREFAAHVAAVGSGGVRPRQVPSSTMAADLEPRTGGTGAPGPD